MKNIIEIKYRTQSRNAEHYHLYSSLLACVSEEKAEKFKFKVYYSAFSSSFTKENDAYLQNRAYAGTKVIESKNEACYRQFRSFNMMVYSKQLGGKPEEVEAAEVLLYLLKPYAKATEKPLIEYIAMVKDLVDALDGDTYVKHIETLKISEQVEALKNSLIEFETAYQERSNEKLARAVMDNMKTIRPVVEKDFTNMANAINALYFVAANIDKDPEATAELEEIIDRINAVINGFHQVVSRRLSITKPKLPTGEEDPSESDPEEEEPTEPDEEIDDTPIEV